MTNPSSADSRFIFTLHFVTELAGYSACDEFSIAWDGSKFQIYVSYHIKNLKWYFGWTENQLEAMTDIHFLGQLINDIHRANREHKIPNPSIVSLPNLEKSVLLHQEFFYILSLVKDLMFYSNCEDVNINWDGNVLGLWFHFHKQDFHCSSQFTRTDILQATGNLIDELLDQLHKEKAEKGIK